MAETQDEQLDRIRRHAAASSRWPVKIWISDAQVMTALNTEARRRGIKPSTLARMVLVTELRECGALPDVRTGDESELFGEAQAQ